MKKYRFYQCIEIYIIRLLYIYIFRLLFILKVKSTFLQYRYCLKVL